MLKFRSMKANMIVSFICVSLCTTIFFVGLFFYRMYSDYESQLTTYREDLMRSKNMMIKSETQAAVSIIQEIYLKQKNGLYTEEQAKNEAANLIRNMKYDDGRGYFWIDTYDGINVVLLGRAGEGKSRLDATDPSGHYYIREMLSKGRNPGGGYTNLLFPKPGESESLPKRNYTMAFEPYQWVIGTGIWIDEIDAMVKERQIAMQHFLVSSLNGMIVGVLLLQILFVALAARLGKMIATPMELITNRMIAMGNGDLQLPEDVSVGLNQYMGREDELGKLSRAMKEMHTKLSDYQKAVLEMARKDALTGLANRRYLHEYIRTRCKPEQLTLITLDLDHFKEVNDTFGHQTGDAALLILSELLKSVFHDGFQVRLGGDEFMVALSHGEPLIETEERLCDFMEQLIGIYKTDAGLDRLTVSAGISCAFGKVIPIDILMQQSDAALYAAKMAGRSCYRVYQPGMELEVEEH